MADARTRLDLSQVPEPDPGRLRKARIAVIDDDTIFVDLMHDLLANGEGYEVVSNSQWVQSYDFVRTTRPDLIILDLIMGREETGWVVLQSLHDDPSTCHIPVILCSAAEAAVHAHATRMRHTVMVEVVAKPFDVEHLLGVIARLLERHSPAQLAGGVSVDQA